MEFKVSFSKTIPLNVCNLENDCHIHSDICTISFWFQVYRCNFRPPLKREEGFQCPYPVTISAAMVKGKSFLHRVWIALQC